MLLVWMPAPIDYHNMSNASKIRFHTDKARYCVQEGYHLEMQTTFLELTRVCAGMKDAENVKKWGFTLFLLRANQSDRFESDQKLGGMLSWIADPRRHPFWGTT